VVKFGCFLTWFVEMRSASLGSPTITVLSMKACSDAEVWTSGSTKFVDMKSASSAASPAEWRRW
jgi:hypothetical protein